MALGAVYKGGGWKEFSFPGWMMWGFMFLFLSSPAMAQAGTISAPLNSTGLVGYWNFEYGKGGATAYDISGNRNHGTLTNMDPSLDWVTGKIGQALDFDGSDDRVLAGQINVSKITISAWVKESVAGGAIVARWNSAGNDAYLYTDSSFAWRVSGAELGVCTFAAPTTNTWSHVVITYDGTTCQAYKNGSPITTTVSDPATGDIQSSTLNTGIGNRPTESNPFNGVLDDVRLYNRALSATEVQRLYKMSTSKYGATSVGEVTNGLVGHWTFDGQDIANVTAYDKSGQNNNGTLTNGPARIAGRLGQALNLDGSDDYVDMNFNALTAYSYAAWIKPLSSSGNIVEERINVCDKAMYIEGDQLVFGWYNAAAAQVVITGGTIQRDAWNFVVGTWDGANRKIYVNGVNVGSDTPSAPCNNSVFWKAIGRADTGSGFTGGLDRSFTGSIDDVRVYNRAVTPDEIKRLYNIGAPGKAAATPTAKGNLAQGLVGHWTFDGKDVLWANNKALDVSGQGNHGTITNMATSTAGIFGRLGQALSFNSVSQFVDLGTPTSFNSLQVPMTISGWFIQKSSSPNGQTIFGQYLSTTAHRLIKLARIDNGTFVYYASTAAGGYQGPFGTKTPALNNWHFFAVVVSGSIASPTLTITVDGSSERFSLAALSSTPDTAAKTYIGSNQSLPATESFNGYIDDVRIYNRALSGEEVKQLYNTGR